MVDPKKVAQGKKNRASGADFERRTRADLSNDGWIVDKWSNNVEWYFETEDVVKQEHPIGRLSPAKRKYAGPGRPMAIGTGFPDFIAFRNISYGAEPEDLKSSLYEAMGVECKSNGNLDKAEKEKCRWYLENGIFGEILIASKSKVKNRIVITYTDFETKYGSVTRNGS